MSKSYIPLFRVWVRDVHGSHEYVHIDTIWRSGLHFQSARHHDTTVLECKRLLIDFHRVILDFIRMFCDIFSLIHLWSSIFFRVVPIISTKILKRLDNFRCAFNNSNGFIDLNEIAIETNRVFEIHCVQSIYMNRLWRLEYFAESKWHFMRNFICRKKIFFLILSILLYLRFL